MVLFSIRCLILQSYSTASFFPASSDAAAGAGLLRRLCIHYIIIAEHVCRLRKNKNGRPIRHRFFLQKDR